MRIGSRTFAFVLTAMVFATGLACSDQSSTGASSHTDMSSLSEVAVSGGSDWTGTFETGMQGWSGDNIERTEDAKAVHSGKTGLIIHTGSNPYEGALIGGDYHKTDDKTIAVDPSSTYKVSVWVKGLENFNGVKMQIQPWGSNGANFHTGVDKPELNGDWQQLSETIKTKSDTTHLGVVIGKSNNPNHAVFALDDFEVKKTG